MTAVVSASFWTIAGVSIMTGVVSANERRLRPPHRELHEALHERNLELVEGERLGPRHRGCARRLGDLLAPRMAAYQPLGRGDASRRALHGAAHDARVRDGRAVH